MAEVAPARIDFRIPVVRELDHRGVALLRLFEIIGRAKKHEREPPLLAAGAAHFDEAEKVAVEVQRRVEFRDADHGVQIAQG